MAHTILWSLACVIVMSKTFAVTAPDVEILTVLMNRIERLELSDSENKREIAILTAKLEEVEENSRKREAELLNELEEIKSTCLDKVTVAADISKAEDQSAGMMPIYQSKEDTAVRDKKQEKRSLIRREAVETEVAFYATHTQHDVRHLGQNAIIVFDKIVSNVGNAYNSYHGAFVAPVGGVYVFHVTVMGQDTHNVSNNHFSAYIDVDSVAYSQLWVEPHDQSSQMFVIELKNGSTVSVKNHYLDDGLVGQHMSSFSGFLLYQRSAPASAIVGK